MWLFFTGIACDHGDYGLAQDGGADGVVPAIELDPMTVDLGAHAEGETATATVTIHNRGETPLELSNVYIDGDSAFTLLSEWPESILPSTHAEVEVAFTASSNRQSAYLTVESNAPADPVISATLKGEGLYPALRVLPDPYYMGSAEPSCPKSGQVEIVNAGTADLEVQSLVLVGEGFEIAAEIEFPFTLAPEASVPVSLGFLGDEAGEVEATLYATSNDPAGVRQAALKLTVEEPPQEASDYFVQPGGPYDATDIFVYVDQSGSMSDDQARLASNFQDFADTLDALLLDWQLMVSTADSGCHNGDILSPYVADANAQFTQAVRGGGGNYTEAGLTITREAFETAGGSGCNAGFLRDEAKTMAVLVSDEPEQSRDSWSSMVDEILDLAPLTSVVAIVGPVPGGCSTAAPGTGYVEAATATGGDSLSICETDWGTYFQDIASLASEEPKDRLQLSWTPNLATLEVTIDSEPTYAWTYDPATNAVVFTTIPEVGSRVEATYYVQSDCE